MLRMLFSYTCAPCRCLVVCSNIGSDRELDLAMLDVPAGELNLDLSSSDGSEMPNESPDLVIDSTEIDTQSTKSGISSSDCEIVAVRMPSKVLTPEQELARMKDQEKYGFLYRLQDRQQHWGDRLKRVRQNIADESPEDRNARRKSFHRAVFDLDV